MLHRPLRHQFAASVQSIRMWHRLRRGRRHSKLVTASWACAIVQQFQDVGNGDLLEPCPLLPPLWHKAQQPLPHRHLEVLLPQQGRASPRAAPLVGPRCRSPFQGIPHCEALAVVAACRKPCSTQQQLRLQHRCDDGGSRAVGKVQARVQGLCAQARAQMQAQARALHGGLVWLSRHGSEACTLP